MTPIKQFNERVKSGELKHDPAQEKAAQALDRLYDEVLAAAQTKRRWQNRLKFWKGKDDCIKGLYLHGGVGRGKSMLMDLFFDCLPETMPRRRVHFHAFMIEVHDYLHSRRSHDDFSEGVDEALPALAELIARQSAVLCFDEFHVTDVADAMILGRLFTALLDRGVIVVATSNWPPEKLYEGGLQRERFLPFIALLQERLEVLHLDSPHDYRTQFLAEEGTYFHPLGKETSAHADKVFETLTNAAPPQPQTLNVKGRAVEVDRAAQGVARFTFAALCEQPLGAEDYLMITAHFHTVFLEDVPKLVAAKRNEAKRLMTLIDVLYEAGTRLIVTAETPADQLYDGEDHGFEFQRTISRLQEMQSRDYIKDARK